MHLARLVALASICLCGWASAAGITIIRKRRQPRRAFKSRSMDNQTPSPLVAFCTDLLPWQCTNS